MNNFTLITNILENHLQSFIRSIPSIMIGLIVLLFAWVFARIGTWIARRILQRKITNKFLQDFVVRSTGTLIFLMGIYLIFEMSNLTGAAVAILSGTGVIGIILGIAFRDITENILASILLSIHHPFQIGDFVDIGHYSGYVQGLTMRVTILTSSEGQEIQIPNSVVYKSHIRNFTINSNRREDFLIGIGFENSIPHVQDLILKVLRNHEEVLNKPEPSVLVERIENAIVQVRTYFWFNGKQYNYQKVKSSVIRLVKQALEAEKIHIPNATREILLPKGLSVHLNSTPIPEESQT